MAALGRSATARRKRSNTASMSNGSFGLSGVAGADWRRSCTMLCQPRIGRVVPARQAFPVSRFPSAVSRQVVHGHLNTARLMGNTVLRQPHFDTRQSGAEHQVVEGTEMADAEHPALQPAETV